LEIQKGLSTLKAESWDDMVNQLDELRVLTIAGALDGALAACANATRQNFKAAKDKKGGKS
jgi:hypothetical protein